jgi:hypothetical protein
LNLQSLLDFTWASQPSAWIGLLTLVALEIVLGIDNIVFISILAGKLPAEQQPKAQTGAGSGRRAAHSAPSRPAVRAESGTSGFLSAGFH